MLQIQVSVSGVPSAEFLRSVWQSAVLPAGAGLCFWVRHSGRSLSGWAFVAIFHQRRHAAAWARFWASRLPARCRGCVVYRACGGWAVSVPCWPHAV